ncbi:4Fe-4S binding protein [Labilibaculum antarcticum]
MYIYGSNCITCSRKNLHCGICEEVCRVNAIIQWNEK